VCVEYVFLCFFSTMALSGRTASANGAISNDMCARAWDPHVLIRVAKAFFKMPPPENIKQVTTPQRLNSLPINRFFEA